MNGTVVRARVNKDQPKPLFPTIITAKVYKPARDTCTGIGFARFDGRIRISSLFDGGLFSKTCLREGDDCLAINDVAGPISPVEAARSVQQTEGVVTITVARGMWSPDVIVATVPKRSVGTKTGVVFGDGRNGTVKILRTVPGSLFGQTDLDGGDVLISVNGIMSQNKLQSANVVRAAVGSVTIVAYSLGRARSQAVEFVFHREYDIEWKSKDECEVTHASAGSKAKFVLLFGSEQNTATYVDISSGRGDNAGSLRDISVRFAKNVLTLNDILAEAWSIVTTVGSLAQAPTIPVVAELIEEPQVEYGSSFLNKLESLASMHREGLLNESEFKSAKNILLGASGA